MTASDIAAKVIGEAALNADIESTSRRLSVRAAEQRDRLGLPVAPRRRASATRSPVSTRRSTSGRRARTPARRSALEWGRNLKAFHPRATGIQQVKEVVVSGWDPKARRRVASTKIDAEARLEDPALARHARHRHATPSSTRSSPPRPRPTRSPSRTLDRLANAWLEAEGRCVGSPQIRAGGKVTRPGGRQPLRRRLPASPSPPTSSAAARATRPPSRSAAAAAARCSTC